MYDDAKVNGEGDGGMDSPLSLTINGVTWHHPPPCSVTTRAAFIKNRPLTVESTGDWRSYRAVDLYCRPAPTGLSDGHWFKRGVSASLYDHPELVHLGRVHVSAQGTFAWQGQYPAYVRSKRLYIVIAVADDGHYAVWGCPFGWFMGPQRGLPDFPDGTFLTETLIPWQGSVKRWMMRGHALTPTVPHGSTLLVETRWRVIRRGDIIVFRPPPPHRSRLWVRTVQWIPGDVLDDGAGTEHSLQRVPEHHYGLHDESGVDRRPLGLLPASDIQGVVIGLLRGGPPLAILD